MYENGQTLVHLAARLGHIKCVMILMHAGININAKTHGENDTALMISAANSHCACVQLLLSRNCDLNAINATGDTALSVAICAPKHDHAVVSAIDSAGCQ